MKLERLLAITVLLLGRKRVSGKELAERFEVSLRTIYRDLEAINQAGIPIVSYSGAAGGYEIIDSYKLDRQLVSQEELHSIFSALKGIQATLEDQEIGALMDKVGALIANNPQTESGHGLIVDFHPWPVDDGNKEKTVGIRKGIKETRLVRFFYVNKQGEELERLVEPMALALKGHGWYLYGYCREREDYRIFKLSRIKNLEVLETEFKRREKSQEELEALWTKPNPSSCIHIVMRFSPSVRYRVEDEFQSSHIEVESDGAILVQTTMPDQPWLYGMLLSYGDAVEVLEPLYVRATLHEKAQEIVRLYEK